MIRAGKRGVSSTLSKFTKASPSPLWQRGSVDQARFFASVVPPVTQDATSSKGPTAIVFMNMGGPSSTDEVHDFLSNLFVRLPLSSTLQLLT